MLNNVVSTFLDGLNHPYRREIELLREEILSAHNQLVENIKWNGPNYSINSHDRITMRILPPKSIQLIFHRGAKKLDHPKNKLLHDPSGLLTWKENDRAVATFKNMEEIESRKSDLNSIVKEWISVTS